MVPPTASTFWSCHNFPAEMGNLLYLKLNVRCGILFFLFLIFAMRKVIFTCLDFSLRLKRRWNEPLFEPEPSPSWGPFKFVSLSLSEQTEPPLSPAVPKPSFKFDAGRGLRLDEAFAWLLGLGLRARSHTRSTSWWKLIFSCFLKLVLHIFFTQTLKLHKVWVLVAKHERKWKHLFLQDPDYSCTRIAFQRRSAI